MTEQQQPLIPATPWWESEVQVRAVLAMAAQLFSIGTRIFGHVARLMGYEPITISGAAIDAIFADLTQAVAIWFGVLAIIKRQKSQLAPLTLTTTGAAIQSLANPPLLGADPTKAPKELKP